MIFFLLFYFEILTAAYTIHEQSLPPTLFANLAANSIFWAWLMVQQFSGRIFLSGHWGKMLPKAACDVKFSDDVRLHALVVEGKPTTENGLLQESRCAGFFTFGLMVFTMSLQEKWREIF